MSSTGRCTVFKLVDHSRRFSWGFRWVFSRSHQAIALSHPTEMYHRLGPLLRLTTTSWGSSYLPYRNTTARALNAPRMIRLASRSAHPFFPHAARHGSWRSSSVKYERLRGALLSRDTLAQRWGGSSRATRSSHHPRRETTSVELYGHCFLSPLVEVWRHGFVAASSGPSPGGWCWSDTNAFGPPVEAIAETCMHCMDNMMLASLIHLLENALEDLRKHGAAGLLSVGTAQPITTTATGTTFMGHARAL